MTDACELFATAIANGSIIVSNSFANTQIMTGEVCAGMGSSAAILYYKDKITYPDNTTEDMNLKDLPLPQNESKTKYANQAGVGLCAYKTTEQKAQAATVFARWFTEERRNMDFVLSAGYIPVKMGAFDKINDYTYKSDAYKSLYTALSTTVSTCTFTREPVFDGYFNKVNIFYNRIRSIQNSLDEKYANGETFEQVVNELKNAMVFAD